MDLSLSVARSGALDVGDAVTPGAVTMVQAVGLIPPEFRLSLQIRRRARQGHWFVRRGRDTLSTSEDGRGRPLNGRRMPGRECRAVKLRTVVAAS
jgi:hypothetical protein